MTKFTKAVIFSLTGFLFILLGGFLLFWFTTAGDPFRIKQNEAIYYSWLRGHYPYLTALDKTKRVEIRLEIYNDGFRTYPYVFYETIYGKDDGVLSLGYILDLDQNLAPVGIKAEHIQVILFPAMEHRNDGGRLRNDYWGRYFTPKDAPTLTQRVVAGDRLFDIRDSVKQKPDYPLSTFADTDPWSLLKPEPE